MVFIVQAFAEEEEGDEHDHGDEGGHSHSKTTIWRGTLVLAAILFFYLVELMLGLMKKYLVCCKVQ